MDRFYVFVAVCHRTRTGTRADEIEQLLLAERFSNEKSEYLATIYEHGRKLLRVAGRASSEMVRRRLQREKESSARRRPILRGARQS
jgi:hypothetical protein